MASRSYAHAVGRAASQAALTSAWLAARDLPPAKRYLARSGAVVASGLGYLATPDGRQSYREIRKDLMSRHEQPDTQPAKDGPPDFTMDKGRALAIAGSLALTIGVTLGRRRLQKHWLARLTRDGHPHPNRAMAVRAAPVIFAAELAVQIINMHIPSSKQD
ncbi:hypothetical protein [Paractinoplanes maris]|uniref:hypothetical protein n=1 Tax=Paractinoplanes maris TaxID=1734446 RepID=UPI002020D9ED|nr:hypothetical protein [Actinoplanes maris]